MSWCSPDGQARTARVPPSDSAPRVSATAGRAAPGSRGAPRRSWPRPSPSGHPLGEVGEHTSAATETKAKIASRRSSACWADSPSSRRRAAEKSATRRRAQRPAALGSHSAPGERRGGGSGQRRRAASAADSPPAMCASMRWMRSSSASEKGGVPPPSAGAAEARSAPPRRADPAKRPFAVQLSDAEPALGAVDDVHRTSTRSFRRSLGSRQ